MKKIFLTIAFAAVLLLGGLQSADAIPARRGSFNYTQPDGTVVVLSGHGDEYYHWLTTSDGTKVQIGEDGYVQSVTEFQHQTGMAKARAKRLSGRTRITSPRLANQPVTGEERYLVILVEFSDKRFAVSNPQQAFSDMLNEEGYDENGSIGSAKDYFYDNSHGLFNPTFDVYGPVTLSNTMSYYGGNDRNGDDKRAPEAFAEACRMVDSQVDFSRYDNDGDGYVDLAFFFYAGYNEAEAYYEYPDTIWPHQWDMSSAKSYGHTVGTVRFDGVTFNKYACSSELKGSSGTDMCGIGSFCHEYSHAIGLPDMYDTISEEDSLDPMLWFSLMDYGCYNADGMIPPYYTAVEREMLGWMEFPDPLSVNGNYTLNGVQNNEAYILPTDNEGEYFVLECRTNYKWDSGFGDTGMLIYHVDKSQNTVTIEDETLTAAELWEYWHYYNAVNNPDHPCCDIVFSSTTAYWDDTKNYFTFPGRANATSFTGDTTPNCRGWNGNDSGAHLFDIAYSNNQSTFRFRQEPTGPLYANGINAIANPGKGKYAAGSQFALELIESKNTPVSVAWYLDGASVSGTSVTLSAGEHTIKAVLTYSSGTTETLEQIVLAQ